MAAMNNGIIPIDTGRSIQSVSNNQPVNRPAGRPSDRGTIQRPPTPGGEIQRIPAGPRFGEIAARPTSSGGATPGAGTGPGSAYLAMVLNELRSTLRMAEAFRQTVAAAEPPAAYARFASRVYALEVRAHQEISRLRSEGITTPHQWLA